MSIYPFIWLFLLWTRCSDRNFHHFYSYNLEDYMFYFYHIFFSLELILTMRRNPGFWGLIQRRLELHLFLQTVATFLILLFLYHYALAHLAVDACKEHHTEIRAMRWDSDPAFGPFISFAAYLGRSGVEIEDFLATSRWYLVFLSVEAGSIFLNFHLDKELERKFWGRVLKYFVLGNTVVYP